MTFHFYNRVPTLLIYPAHQKSALKFDILLCLGVHLHLSSINYASNFCSPPVGAPPGYAYEFAHIHL